MQETIERAAPPTRDAQEHPFQVQVMLNPEDVSVSVSWRLTGSKSDWDATLGGAFLAELYSHTHALSHAMGLLKAEYGLLINTGSIPADTPLPAPAPEPPVLVIENNPAPPAPTLNERIERAERQGSILPTTKKPAPRSAASPREVREWQDVVMKVLRENGGEMRLSAIKERVPERYSALGSPEAFRQRVVTLVEQGRLATRRDESAKPVATYYRYLPREGEDQESHTWNPLARAAALVRGRRVLLIGGKPNQERKAQLEGPLGLILRWPDLGPDQEWDVLRAEVLRQGYDYLFINNKFRRHYFGQLPALAREHGIPFITLPRGNSTAQVADAVLSNAAVFRQEAMAA